VDARARELGALIVMDGGAYLDSGVSCHHAKLFIGTDRLWVLDARLRVLSEIPLQQVRALSVEAAGADWKLHLDCGQTKPEFLYQGDFSEHLAGIAAATLRSRLFRELPVLN